MLVRIQIPSARSQVLISYTGFALYRALLKGCLRVPIPQELAPKGPVNPLKHLVRKGFRRHVRLTSPTLIGDAFKVGHNVYPPLLSTPLHIQQNINADPPQARKLFYMASSSSGPALTQIHSMLSLLNARRAVSASQPPPPRKEIPRVWPYPGAPKLIDIRPLPKSQLSAIRRVPHLVEASGFAFLRIKKPQSPFLSRVLRQTIKKQIKRYNRQEKMTQEAADAEAEEEWEDIIVERMMDEVEEGSDEEGRRKREAWLEGEGREWAMGNDSWKREFLEARREAKATQKRVFERAKEQGRKMVEIYEEEKLLWKKEKNERRREKTGRWPKGEGPNGAQVGAQDVESSTTGSDHVPSSGVGGGEMAERLVSYRTRLEVSSRPKKSDDPASEAVSAEAAENPSTEKFVLYKPFVEGLDR